MTAQDEARERARLLLAWADEKTLQQLGKPEQWSDYDGEKPPVIFVASCWRIKPEPRRAWSVGNHFTENADAVKQWRENGGTVTEWMEVLP